MRIMQWLRKYAGTTFAFVALAVAQASASKVCIIFYQDEIPEGLKRN